MSKSIFSYLTSYVPTENRDSKEDYLTQMFARVLENVNGIADKYVGFLCKKVSIPYEPGKAKIIVTTQHSVPSGRIDLLIRVGNDLGFICEHKIGSELSENQIQKYMDDSSNLGPQRYYSVLLTFSVLQHTQKADISIIWSDIYELIENLSDSYDAEDADAFVLKQFLDYLSENNMGKSGCIPKDALLCYTSVLNLENQLNDIFKRLEPIDYKSLCPGIEKIGKTFSPTFNRKKWGRVGIDMFKEWDMGLFVGVILDHKDHKLKPLNPEKGPDFVVLLESDYSKHEKDEKKKQILSEIYNKNTGSPEYCRLCSKLSCDSGRFDFITGISDSPWRIAVLRISLYDVLYGNYSKDEQIQAIQDASVEMINLMIQAMQ